MIRGGIFFLIVSTVLFNSVSTMRFTPLHVDNHPCKPENLKATNRYICDNNGNVICQSGWKNPDNFDPLHNLNPCLEPICQGGCAFGDCRAPDFCSCQVGWEGSKCDKCIPLPGCIHGSCQKAFECICEPGWAGAYCDIPQCSNCTNGDCIGPEECVCNEGWSGSDCNTCQKMPGCVHGDCLDQPHTCKCQPGWEGHLCDKPLCSPSCEHGFCHVGLGNSSNFCVCQTGWKGDSCSECVPYWKCPNTDVTACTKPNECICLMPAMYSDPEGLCNNPALTNVEAFKATNPASFKPASLFD